jgi:hypothetical protein
MAKTNNTHPSNATSNTKWEILRKLRVGKLTRSIREELKRSKTCVLGHIRDLRKLGLVHEFGGARFKPTQKGYSISPQDFQKMVYLGGGRSQETFSTGNDFGFLRYHNVSFSVDILNYPKTIPQDARPVELKNNVFYCKSYLTGTAKFHRNKAVLSLYEIFGGDVEECSLKALELLEELKKEVAEDGFILDSLFKCNSQHIADPLNHLAEFIGKKFGACVLVSSDDGGERLTIDFSKGVPELETENKYFACEDMEKIQTMYKGILSLPLREVRERFS